MAKSSRKPSTSKKRTGKSKRATSSRASETHPEAHVDGCDFEFHPDDATADADLPPAKGGVEEASAKRRR